MNKSKWPHVATIVESLRRRRWSGSELRKVRYETKSAGGRIGAAPRGILCLLVGLLWASSARAQVSPEDHAKHHPGAAGAGAIPAAPGAAPAMGAMPPAGGSPAPGGMGGIMEGMGEMMKGMGAPPKKELYPSLMALSELSPEQRKHVEEQASERMHAGSVLIGQALDSLNAGTQSGDYAAMHEAMTRLREGAAQLESGIAARRALAEGRAPREVALAWFKREMALSPAPAASGHREVFGGAAFHLTVIVILAAFAAAMIWLYFARMRRATDLLRSLTGMGASAAPAAAAPATESAAASIAPGPATARRKWSGNLRVASIFQETPNVKTFRLMNPVGGALPFDYLPGQFLTVTALLEGKPVKRSYTIASSPTRHDYAEITVKREESGLVSKFLDDKVKVGDLLEFSGPSGSFTFTGRECNCILLIAGGVGITPMMSVLRYLLDRSWPGDIFLLFSIGRPEDFIFREEIEHLARRHTNLRVAVTASRPEGTDWKGLRGRISKELILQSVPDVSKRYVHICGPVPMMEAAKKLLAELGVPAERIKSEAFGPVLGKPVPQLRATQPTVTADDASGMKLPTVTFSTSDKSAPLPPDKPILEVADEVGVDIDNSCRVGTCGVCRTRLLKGEVTMDVEDGLEPGDKEKNIILVCVAKSKGNVVVEA